MKTTDRIILIGCVKSKRQGDWPARDVYDSPLWRARRDYADRSGVPWYVFSAKFGLLDPNERIDWYDVTMSDLSADERESSDRPSSTVSKPGTVR